nr:hypothetical protein [Tanacetum cinerariifolium]
MFVFGIPIDSSLTFSYLFFADDDIFVGKSDSLNIRTIFNVLKCFHLASGLNINFHKSKLMGIETRPEEVDALAKTMGCLIFTTSFVYLGVKVGGGRLTLIKSVLTSIPLYYMSIFKVSPGVLKLLESIRRNFFNRVDGSKRKMAWISWNKVLLSKKYSGLRVFSIYALNRAFLFKWGWRFFSPSSCLWTRFITAIYGEDSALNSLNSLSKRYPWLDIIREDPWLDDLALKHKLPRLYKLDNYKQITIGKKIDHASMFDTFRHPPRGGAKEEQLTFLLSRLGGLILTNISNCWVWSIEDTDKFSVIFVRQLLDDLIFQMRMSPQ